MLWIPPQVMEMSPLCKGGHIGIFLHQTARGIAGILENGPILILPQQRALKLLL